ncbi:type II toxin-antitoxin system tRNA(fMet)-specific endonuclease VapC [Sinimarinibacterium flocculans]|uniref:Ribonuclease VapC n=1 Tax=Sinimarinibacterium flocculans TaxID=985250 RepID=A0A318EAD7_9GAMM|nr:type II toxin-antitoxin system VapC family toxin [Sinimarinibacterium flocculans]PXV66508.1 tRNA(fMet)-specific endonuclease VapC [Sinimarinibacterium flocculans]
MARFLLDTNICIYIRQKRPPEVLARFEKLKAGDAVLSVVTYGELLYGAHKSKQREIALARLADLVSLLPVLEMPSAAAAEYGEIRANLERKGEKIGGNDLWIAAHAKAEGLILVTNNEREFKRVPGLKLQNWAASS